MSISEGSQNTPYLNNILEQINLLLEYEDFEFSEKLSDDDKMGTAMFSGRNVDWYGDPESMIVIHKDDVYSRVDNIFYPKKLENLENLIRNSEDNVEILCSYGMGEIITFDDITEQQTAFKNDRFYQEYSWDTPMSLGDEDLDNYVGDESYSLDEVYFDDEELKEFLEENVYSFEDDIDELRDTFKNMAIKFAEDHPDNEPDMYDEGELAEEWFDHADEHIFSKIEEIQNVIKNKGGDLGRFVVQLRDSNHRIQGAINAGEEYVCIELYSLSKDPKRAKRFEGKYELVKDL